MPQLTTGSTIAGYRVEGFLGRGGMGEVYRARESGSGRVVALKLVAAGADDGFLERFRRESQLAASLESPHVVPVYGTGVVEGRAFIAMRLVEGADLASVLASGPLEVGRTLSILSQVAEGLDAAHDRGLVHRDVKPANILLEPGEDGESAFLSDFGLVKELATDDGVTSTGTVLGTPDYLAPEQVLSGAQDARSDVYALGCVLFQMLSGRVPFPRDSEVAKVWAHVNDDPPSLAELAPGLPVGLDAVVARAMAKEPEERYGSAGELARAAVAAAGDELPEGVRVVGAPDSERAPTACPYMGLAAFQPEDAAFFFGREELVGELVGKLEHAGFLAVVGASGSGKSSLVRAGLLPALERPFTLISPGEHPLEALAGAGEGILAVDQFEELFTLCRDDHERAEFVRRLLDRESPVVIALRADFSGQCAEYPALASAIENGLALVGPMREPELRAAIVKPAQRVGLHLEHRLVETALHDVAGQPGALPLLSHALLETWKRRIGRALTLGGYVEAGGVEGALAKTAEDVYQQLEADEQMLARSIFLRLTALGEGTEDTRRRVAASELVPRAGEEDRVEQVLERLADARLVTRDDGTVEVAHEALIRHWPTLRAWLDEDREGRRTHRQLTEAAQEWDRTGRDASSLYRGARLATATEWADEHPGEPNDQERDFLTASREAAQSELDQIRKRNRRLRLLAAALVVLLIGAAIAAIIAVQQTGQAREQERNAKEQEQIARDQEQIAREQEQVATSRALAGRSGVLLDRRVDQALLVALEGYRASPTFEARSAVLAAIQRTSAFDALLGGRQTSLTAIAVSADGNLVVAGDGTGGLQLWNVSERRPLGERVNLHPGSEVHSLAFDASENRLAVGFADGSVWLVELGPGGTASELLQFAGPPEVAFVAGSDRIVAAAAFDGLVRVWNAETGTLVDTVRLDVSGRGGISLSRDGNTIATFGPEGARTMLIDSRESRPAVPARDSSMLVVSPDGSVLATLDAAGAIDVWDAGTGSRRSSIQRSNGAGVSSMGFSQNGRLLAVGTETGNIEVYNTKTGTRRNLPSAGHGGAVIAATYTSSGNLVSAGRDGLIAAWARNGASLVRALSFTQENFDVAVSPVDSRIAITRIDGVVDVLDGETGERLASFSGNSTEAKAAFAPDGNTLAVTGSGGELFFYNLDTLTPDGDPIQGPSQNYAGLIYSADGSLIATPSDDGTITLWDAATREVTRVVPAAGSEAGLFAGALSRDGKLLAVAGKAGALWLVDLSAPDNAARRLEGHDGNVYDVSFSPDSRMLASTSADGTLRLWDVADATPASQALTSRVGALLTVEFSPDGRTLATLGSDEQGSGGLELWDVERRLPLGDVVPLVLSTSSSGAFRTVDGSLVAQAENIISRFDSLLWASDAERLSARVCKLVARNLTRAEWTRLIPDTPYRETCPQRQATAEPDDLSLPQPSTDTVDSGSSNPLPREPAPLQAGTYTTTLFTPEVSLTLGEGWVVFAPELSRFFSIARSGEPLRLVAFSKPVRIVPQDWNGDEWSGDYSELQDEMIPVPDDLAGWFASHPRHETGKVTPITVDGIRGSYVDVETVSGYNVCGPQPCVVSLVPSPDLTLYVEVGQTARHIFITIGGEPIVVSIIAPDDAFADFVPEAMKIVSNVRFDDTR